MARTESRQQVTDVEGELAQVLGREPEPGFAAEAAEECQRLMESLGDALLESVAQLRMEGVTVPEIAERLGLSRGTRVRIGRTSYLVSAIVEKMPSSSGFALAPPAIMDEAGLAMSGLIQPGSISTTSYRIVLPAGADPESIGKSFQQRFADGGWRATDPRRRWKA